MANRDRKQQFNMKTVILRYAFVVVTNIYSQEKKRKEIETNFIVSCMWGSRLVRFFPVFLQEESDSQKQKIFIYVFCNDAKQIKLDPSSFRQRAFNSLFIYSFL